MLIGLSAKNGILIVEFAEQLRARGMSVADAAVEAARIRLRPILMTSLAFILGVMPLVFASGAGQEARHSVGTAVAGGMLASTFLNLLFIPVLYVVVKRHRGGGTVRRARSVRRARCVAVGVRAGRWPLLLAPQAAHAQPPSRPSGSRSTRRSSAPSRAIRPRRLPRRAFFAPTRCSRRRARRALLQVNANATSTTLNRGVEFEGTTVTPRTSVTAGARRPHADLRARRLGAPRRGPGQAQDVAELSAAKTQASDGAGHGRRLPGDHRAPPRRRGQRARRATRPRRTSIWPRELEQRGHRQPAQSAARRSRSCRPTRG